MKGKSLDSWFFFSLNYRIYKTKKVGPKGFEPMTSALSKQRSKPTELRSHLRTAKMRNGNINSNNW
jgi:hypothetical protein